MTDKNENADALLGTAVPYGQQRPPSTPIQCVNVISEHESTAMKSVAVEVDGVVIATAYKPDHMPAFSEVAAIANVLMREGGTLRELIDHPEYKAAINRLGTGGIVRPKPFPPMLER